MKRVWRLSTQVNNNSLFTTDYEENKKALGTVSEISSKKLRNQIAGCITKIKNNEQKNLKDKNINSDIVDVKISDNNESD